MGWFRKALVVGATSAMLSAPTLGYQNFMEVKPSPQQVAWQDLEFGVIVHFSTNTFLDREWGDGRPARPCLTRRSLIRINGCRRSRRRSEITSCW